MITESKQQNITGMDGVTHPGMITMFFGSGAHCLNTNSDKPACNMPGVANRTCGPGALTYLHHTTEETVNKRVDGQQQAR